MPTKKIMQRKGVENQPPFSAKKKNNNVPSLTLFCFHCRKRLSCVHTAKNVTQN